MTEISLIVFMMTRMPINAANSARPSRRVSGSLIVIASHRLVDPGTDGDKEADEQVRHRRVRLPARSRQICSGCPTDHWPSTTRTQAHCENSTDPNHGILLDDNHALLNEIPPILRVLRIDGSNKRDQVDDLSSQWRCHRDGEEHALPPGKIFMRFFIGVGEHAAKTRIMAIAPTHGPREIVAINPPTRSAMAARHNKCGLYGLLQIEQERHCNHDDEPQGNGLACRCSCPQSLTPRKVIPLPLSRAPEGQRERLIEQPVLEVFHYASCGHQQRGYRECRKGIAKLLESRSEAGSLRSTEERCRCRRRRRPF